MPHEKQKGGALWFFKKVAVFFLILAIIIAAALTIRKIGALDRFMHRYIGIPVTVWTAVGMLRITGSKVSVKRSVMSDGTRPNLDTIYNSEPGSRPVRVGPGCTARKHIFLAIAFALAFPLLSWPRRFILAGITTAIMIFFSGIRIVTLYHLRNSDLFDKIHEIDGYILAGILAVIWIVLALWLMPPLDKLQTAGDETLVDDTPKTVAEKASNIKP
ncbi:MAG: exosortase/archaeosortase family protein [Planctomycetota bacterium]|nr:MAG: exosortase/archaeosortase family protein [Planctomycetota bacterium]